MRKVIFFIALTIGLGVLTGEARVAFAVGLSPATFSYDARAGAEIPAAINLTNDERTTLNLTPSVQDFIASDDESGTPIFLPEGSTSRTSMASWVHFDDPSIQLERGQTRTTTFTIRIPIDTPAGSYYGAIFFSDQSADASNYVGIKTKIGSLILLTVAGETKREVQIESFTTDRPVFSALPIDLRLRIKNSGNVIVQPIGAITIQNMFGKVVAKLPINEASGGILPDSTRRFDAAWANPNESWKGFGLGPYTATVFVNDRGETLTSASTLFWIVSWPCVLLLLAGVGLMSALARALWRKTRKPTIVPVIFLFLVGSILGIHSQQTFAATITTSSDTLSDETIAVPANHTIVFVTPSGVDEGETISITFPSGFDLSGIDSTDVTLTDNSTELSLAADCSGSEQASAVFSGQTLTLTICAGDGGAMTATDEVTIAIQNVINPSSSGAYFLGINGSFGDQGSIAVPIIDDGSVGVTARVTSGGGGGGGCVGTCGSSSTPESESDIVPPNISSIKVTGVDESSATVSWETNESATCMLVYGTTNGYGLTADDEGSSTVHSADLTGLNAETSYHFSIVCEDESGNENQSADDTFTTDEGIDTPPTNASELICFAGDSELGLSWTLPSDDDVAGTILTCSTGGYPDDTTDGTILFSGDENDTSTTVSATNDIRQYCSLFVYDQAEQFSSGTLVSCVPTGVEEEPTEVPEEPTEPETPETPVVPGTTDTPTAPETPETPTTTSPPATNTPSDTPNTPTTPGTSTDPEVIPPTTTTNDEGIDRANVRFFGQEPSVELNINNDTIEVIPGKTITVMVLTSDILNKTVADSYVVLDNNTYQLRSFYQAGVLTGYQAEISAPAGTGATEISLGFFYTDGSTQSLRYTLNGVALGYVYEVNDGQAARVPDAVVTLLRLDNGSWEIASTATNPVLTGVSGTIGWYIPNGTYRMEVIKDGYETTMSDPFVVTNNIATARVLIRAIPIFPTEEPSSTASAAIASVGTFATASLQQIRQTLDHLREIPEVQVATDVAVPAAVVIGATSLGALTFAFDLIPMLQYITTAPFLFWGNRRRKAWGVVYHTVSKAPIDLAIVRLYKLPENKIIATRVTDKKGRYVFLTQPGDYRLVVVKPAMSFPSILLGGRKEDGNYTHLYHGEPINVNQKNAAITVNIPLDPSSAATYHTPRRLRFMRLLRKLQLVFSLVGLVLATGIFAIRPTGLTLIGLVFQLLVLFAVIRLVQSVRKPKGWGIVSDAVTHKAMQNAVVRIFEPTYNKLLETALTDAKGRYSFLVGPNEYFTTYEKEGYQKMEIRPIDRRNDPEPGEITIDVHLNPEQKTV